MPIYISAFGPQAAEVAGRRADGLWTLADPENAPKVIEAYRGACDDAGREPGEIILQTGFSWAEDDDAALEGARVWKATQPPEFFTEDWSVPADMYGTPRARSPTTTSRRATSSPRTPSTMPSASARWRRWARPSYACRTARAPTPTVRCACTASRCCPTLRGARV